MYVYTYTCTYGIPYRGYIYGDLILLITRFKNTWKILMYENDFLPSY